MIGDHLSRRSIKRLKLSGSLAVLSFYLLCVIQSERWVPYSAICAPLVASIWIWGLSHYKQPRSAGKIANFGNPLGLSSSRITPREPPVVVDFQGGSLINLGGEFDNLDGLLVRRESSPPGGRSFQYATSTTIRFEAKKGELALGPPTRVSRYKKVSDPESWVV